MWYEIFPSLICFSAGLVMLELGPWIAHSLSWPIPMARTISLERPSEVLLRRDQRISDTILQMHYMANHQWSAGLEVIPDTDEEYKQPLTYIPPKTGPKTGQ